MSVEYKDYYSILGVPRNATDKEIKSAYRKLAREYHPDVNQGAEDKFKDINEAYEALQDPERRRMYDNLGSNWRQGQNFTPPPGYENWQTVNINDLGGFGGGAGGFSSFFDAIFGGMGAQGYSNAGYTGQGFGGGDSYDELFGGRGQRSTRGGRGRAAAPEQLNIEQDLPLDLEEVVHGVKKDVITPGGRRMTVNVPKGVSEGAKIRLAGEGAQGRTGKGDLLLNVRYRKHPHFKVEENNLVYEAPVLVPDLVLGAEIQVPTLQGEVSMKIPASTQPGRLMRLKGQGLPGKNGKAQGDLLVRIKAIIPENPSEREQALYRELKALQNHS